MLGWAGLCQSHVCVGCWVSNSEVPLLFSFLPLLRCSAFCVFIMVCDVNAHFLFFALYSCTRSIFFEEIMLASILYLFSLYSR